MHAWVQTKHKALQTHEIKGLAVNVSTPSVYNYVVCYRFSQQIKIYIDRRRREALAR
jgi:hypothetical protein